MHFFLSIVVHVRVATVFQEQNSTSFPDTDNIFACKLIGLYFCHLLQKKTERKVKAERKEVRKQEGRQVPRRMRMTHFPTA